MGSRGGKELAYGSTTGLCRQIWLPHISVCAQRAARRMQLVQAFFLPLSAPCGRAADFLSDSLIQAPRNPRDFFRDGSPDFA